MTALHSIISLTVRTLNFKNAKPTVSHRALDTQYAHLNTCLDTKNNYLLVCVDGTKRIYVIKNEPTLCVMYFYINCTCNSYCSICFEVFSGEKNIDIILLVKLYLNIGLFER